MPAAPGLEDVEIRETHRVHENAASAIIRARKSATSAITATTTTAPSE